MRKTGSKGAYSSVASQNTEGTVPEVAAAFQCLLFESSCHLFLFGKFITTAGFFWHLE
jgi:hypothetical protein